MHVLNCMLHIIRFSELILLQNVAVSRYLTVISITCVIFQYINRIMTIKWYPS